MPISGSSGDNPSGPHNVSGYDTADRRDVKNWRMRAHVRTPFDNTSAHDPVVESIARGRRFHRSRRAYDNTTHRTSVLGGERRSGHLDYDPGISW